MNKNFNLYFKIGIEGIKDLVWVWELWTMNKITSSKLVQKKKNQKFTSESDLNRNWTEIAPNLNRS